MGADSTRGPQSIVVHRAYVFRRGRSSPCEERFDTGRDFAKGSAVLSKRATIAGGDFNHFRKAVSERRQRGAPLLDLTGSNPTLAALDYDWAALQEQLINVDLRRYDPDSAGAYGAREAIVRHLQPSEQDESFGFVDIGLSARYRVDNLVLTSSTSEGYSYLFKLLCDPGDVVLVPEPSYPLFEQLARYEGVTLAGYQLRYDGAWYVDLDSLKTLTKLRPKAIVLVAPNNPTGSCYSPPELETIASLKIPLIVDQVFAPFVRAQSIGHVGVPSESDAPLVFALDGLSKRCGLPQLKLAWTAVSGPCESVRAAIRALNQISDAFLSPNMVTQTMLDGLLTLSRPTMHSIRRRLDTNRGALHSQVERGWPVSVYHYQGGWSAMLRLPSFRTDEEWAYWCLERGVLVQPSWLYDCHERSTLVVSLLSPPDDFATALQLMAEALQDE